MNKKPIELHLIESTKPRTTNPVLIPDTIKKRIPEAEWLSNYDKWDKTEFINETADFLFDVYGIGNNQDKHTLAMLANEIDVYVECCKNINNNNIVIQHNNGATMGSNPYLIERGKSLKNIIQLMNELGLTPRGRLSINKPKEDSSISKFLKGPKG